MDEIKREFFKLARPYLAVRKTNFIQRYLICMQDSAEICRIIENHVSAGSPVNLGEKQESRKN